MKRLEINDAVILAGNRRLAVPPLSDWESQLRKGSLDLAIFAILFGHPCYSLEIIRELKAVAGVELAEGTLYPILRRLTQESLLEAKWVHAAGSSYPRKCYQATEAGRRRAFQMMQAWDGFAAGMSQLLKRLRKTEHGRKTRNIRQKAR